VFAAGSGLPVCCWKAAVAAVLPDGSGSAWRHGKDIVIGVIVRGVRIWLNAALLGCKKLRSRFAHTVHRLAHERHPKMNAPANLRRELVEARGSELAGGLSYRRR
jgi:hypothetical protein